MGRLYALVGRPVGHSLSPAIHNPLFREHGLDAAYILVELPPSADVGVAELIARLGLDGVNLTVPFKQAVLDDLADISPMARAIGAVNVVVRGAGGLIGDNTDALGFVRGLVEDVGALPEGDAILLGAGGAARAVAAGLADAGVPAVHILNRSVGRACTVATELAGHFSACAFAGLPLDEMSALAPRAGLVVNCTSGSADAVVGGLSLDGLPGHAVVCDINYYNAAPRLLVAAEARGLRTHDGLPMLVHQGVLAFERFTGIAADPAPVLRRLRA